MNSRITLVCLLVAVACCNSLTTAMPSISDMINNFEDRVNDLTKNFPKINDSLEKLFGDVQNFTGNMKDVASCFVSELNDQDINIFNGSLKFSEVVEKYYKAFPEKNMTTERLENLLKSVKDMLTSCTDPEIKNTSLKFGFTELSDNSEEEINTRMGLVPPSDESNAVQQQRRRRKREAGMTRVRDDVNAKEDCVVPDNMNLPQTYDYREQNVVTSVKNQGQCGSCWTFATAASIESAILLKAKNLSSTTDVPSDLDLSEQQLVNCASDRDGCQGGYSYLSFNYVLENNIELAEKNRYKAQNEQCRYKNGEGSYRISQYCIRSRNRYTRDMEPEELSDIAIASTLIKFGPLYIGVNAGGRMFQNYRGGVMDSNNCDTRINHAVTLVGYDQDGWIIKNSWGKNWGENGFFRLKHGKNLCGVNTEIAWPIVRESDL